MKRRYFSHQGAPPNGHYVRGGYYEVEEPIRAWRAPGGKEPLSNEALEQQKAFFARQFEIIRRSIERVKKETESTSAQVTDAVQRPMTEPPAVDLTSENHTPEAIVLNRPAFIPALQGKRTIDSPGTGNGGGRRGPHEERLEFLDQFRDIEVARFQFDRQSGSFAGYTCIVYPHLIHLDAPVWGQAAYDYTLDTHFLPSLGIDLTKRALDSADVERLKAYLTEHVVPEGTTKREFVERGAVSRRHIGDWQGYCHEKIRSGIELT